VENQQARKLFGRPAAQALGHAAHSHGVGARPDVENHGPAGTHEWQTPFGGYRRRAKRLCNRHAVLLGLLLLGATLDNIGVGELARGLAQERALAPIRLEQCHLSVRQGRRERDSRRATAGADVDDRSRKALDHLYRPKALVNVHAPRFGAVPDRGQAWGL
jgi:hypothetical protein